MGDPAMSCPNAFGVQMGRDFARAVIREFQHNLSNFLS